MLGISAFARQCLGGAVMTLRFLLLTILLWFCFDSAAQADDFAYAAIAKRFGETRLDAQSVQEARMHGECLVGLKHLIFVKRAEFDPVAEWINYRTLSLLEQFPPCNVLIMMEGARHELMKEDEQS